MVSMMVSIKSSFKKSGYIVSNAVSWEIIIKTDGFKKVCSWL